MAAVSALTGAGCDRLLQEIEQRLARDRQVATYRLGHDRAVASPGSISMARCWSATTTKTARASPSASPPTTAALRNEPTCLAELAPMKSPDVHKVAALIAEVAATEIQPLPQAGRPRAAREGAWRHRHHRRRAGRGRHDPSPDGGSCPLDRDRRGGGRKDPKLVERLLHDQVAWIVDPVDGTANFAEGKEEFVSMVALVRGDDLIASWFTCR